MNPADEEAAKLVATEGQSPGAVAASDDQFEEQLRATLKDVAGWVQQLGRTKPPVVESKAAPVTQTAPEMVAPKAPAAPSLNPQQAQKIQTDIAAVRQAIERHLADVRETVEQLAASQNQMAREIEKLQTANQEILAKIPTPPPQPAAAPTRKPVRPPPKSAPTPFWGRLAPR
jgi:hypothetical protein